MVWGAFAFGAVYPWAYWPLVATISAVGLAGLLVGIPGAIAASGTLSSFLYGLEPDDVVTLALSVLVLSATALVAGYFPARRAARVDPAVTLRVE